MKVLVFEFMVGGGVADQHPLNEELQTFYHQGHSMLTAVCKDLLLLGHEVFALADIHAYASLPKEVVRVSVESEQELDPTLWGAANLADYILLIAPETDGCLEHFAELLSGFSNKIMSPNIGFIKLAANKWKCHNWFSDRDVPCPDSILLSEDHAANDVPADFFPCVAKPVDGAGSEDVLLVASFDELASISKPMLLQRFVPGVPASVSVIIESLEKIHFLEPGQQIFDAEPFGVHLRTEFPLAPPLRERALKLARLVVEASPGTIGYFGIDMILADDPDNDVLIEINPRLTTSYCYLREWAQENLAEKFPLLDS